MCTPIGEKAQQRMTLAMTSVSFTGDGEFIDGVQNESRDAVSLGPSKA
jgi:hypothetical protein